MKEKNKGKKMNGKEFRAKKDMDQILSDSRFSHVPFDPKLRHMPKDEHKVKLDSRFSSMFSDEKFYEKSTMDPRGRKGNYSTKEDLHKFYRLSSDESDDEEEREDHIDEPEKAETKKKKKEMKNIDEPEKTEKKKKKKEKKNIEEPEKAETKKEKKSGETPKDEVDDQNNVEEISQDIRERLQDLNQDYARGVLLFSDDSSDDGSSSEEEEEEEEFDWGELDQDAVWDTEQEVEETSRIAVCNLDWNHIKAVDILVVFHSFCPRGGSVNKVTIYPSEFGKQRLAEEDRHGPMQLMGETAIPKSNKYQNDNDVDLDKLAKGKLDYKSEGNKGKYEALRRYERDRLRYYYAVVECDSVDTAKTLYKQCDGQSFERAGVLMDLRYIPTDMDFDEAHHDFCESVPEFYEAKLFTTTALFDSQPTLTWDQTDPHREKVLSNAMKSAMSGKEFNEEYLKNFIASSSDDDSDPAEAEEDYSSDEGEGAKNSRIANFRALIQEIDEKEKKKKEGRFDMEHVFGTKGKEDSESDSSDDDSDKDEEDLNPFEKYLEKKRNKRKEKQKKLDVEKKEDSSDNGDEPTHSDDEPPEGMEEIKNDPFFAEELKKREKKKKKGPKKEEKEEEEDKGDLELLLMDEDQEEKQHFSMREIIEDHKGKSKKKLKKKDRKKREEKLKSREKNVDDFKVDTSDPRFSNLLTSGDYNIDPSHPQFKRTQAVDNLINDVQKKRIAESFENMPEPKRINVTKGKEEHELSMLVKRVKNKAKKPT